MAEAHRRGWNEGYKSGSESSASYSRSRTERLEQRVKELEEQLDDALEVGDRVLLPENYVSRMKTGPGPTLGVVSKLGTTYRGPMSDIVRRAPAMGE